MSNHVFLAPDSYLGYISYFITDINITFMGKFRKRHSFKCPVCNLGYIKFSTLGIQYDWLTACINPIKAIKVLTSIKDTFVHEYHSNSTYNTFKDGGQCESCNAYAAKCSCGKAIHFPQKSFSDVFKTKCPYCKQDITVLWWVFSWTK